MLAPGEVVRVKDQWPEAAGPAHIRTPYYVRGVVGEVVRHLGDLRNPEDLAFGRPAAAVPLYHVRFVKSALWPEDKTLEPGGPKPVGAKPGRAKPGGYEPVAVDDVLVEIFGHWLERP